MPIVGKGIIMFLIRAAFWLNLVIAIIPVRQVDLEEGQRPVTTMETVGLAQSVANDISSFCDRNEETCTTGKVLISQMGAKAREGARIVYVWLDERYGNNEGIDGISDQMSTGSIRQQNDS